MKRVLKYIIILMFLFPLVAYAKIDETLNTYSHIFDNKMDEVVNTINKLNQTNDKS